MNHVDINSIEELISIHAPVWGATARARRSGQSCGISIHAPVWGATVAALGLRALSRISIHAPVWGATLR